MRHNFIEMAAVTDVGSVRQFNEDSIVTAAEIGAAVLADGMGANHHEQPPVSSRRVQIGHGFAFAIAGH
jgi:serine/threonine protein phosphatase PrpC